MYNYQSSSNGLEGITVPWQLSYNHVLCHAILYFLRFSEEINGLSSTKENNFILKRKGFVVTHFW